MKKILLLVALLGIVFGMFAQCPSSTPGILSYGSGSPVLNYNEPTPAATYSQAPSGLPNTEFIITDPSKPTGNGDEIVGITTNPVFLPGDYGFGLYDTFCITPFSYDLAQIQAVVQEILNGSVTIIPFPPVTISCCDAVNTAVGVDGCLLMNQAGITSGTSVKSMADAFVLLQSFLGGGGASFTIQDIIDGFVQANSAASGVPFSDCGLNRFPLCYSVSVGTPLCYSLDCIYGFTLVDTVDATICQGEIYTLNGVDYTTTGVYRDTFPWGSTCDSVIHLNLTVEDTHNVVVYDTICDNNPITFGGATLSNTGVYNDVLTSSGGCDSTVQLWLEVLDAYDISLSRTICTGDSFSVGPFTYYATGAYSHVLTTTEGCDSMVTLSLNVVNSIANTINATICAGGSYMVGGNTYTTPGSYFDTLTAGFGCDSIVNLNLSTTSTILNYVNSTICDGDSVDFAGTYYTTTTLINDTFMASGGCDSIVTFDLTVNPTYSQTLYDTICDGDFYQVGSNFYTQSGNFLNNLSTTDGCDSIIDLWLEVLFVHRNVLVTDICQGDTLWVGTTPIFTSGSSSHVLTAQNGCDSTIDLWLTVRSIDTVITNGFICDGDAYSFNGSFYTTPGFYVDTLTSFYGCDSFAVLNLTVFPTQDTTIYDTICQGNVFTVGTNTYDTTGQYLDTLTNIYNCDSVIELWLEVLSTYSTSLNETICTGDTFFIGSQPFSSAGSYSHVLQATNGCDSLVNLNLSLQNHQTFITYDTICQGDTLYLAGYQFFAAGTYSDSAKTANGCDSTLVLELTVLPNALTNLAISICEGESYSVGSSTYDSAGSYSDTMVAFNGCDSVVNLSLIVNANYSNTFNDTICDGDSLFIGPFFFTATGTYSDTLQSSSGCDSFLTLNLTVLKTDLITINDTICDGDTFYLFDQNLTQSGTYWDTLVATNGCDSVIFQVNLEVKPVPLAGFTYTQDASDDKKVIFTNTSTGANTYAWEFGDANTSADENPMHTYAVYGSYAVELTASDDYCSDILLDTIYLWPTGIDEAWNMPVLLRLYPNPNNGEFYIEIGGSDQQEISVMVHDLAGKLIYDQTADLSNGKHLVKMGDQPAGTYIVSMEVNGVVIRERIIIGN